jgi:hypothetical protein
MLTIIQDTPDNDEEYVTKYPWIGLAVYSKNDSIFVIMPVMSNGEPYCEVELINPDTYEWAYVENPEMPEQLGTPSLPEDLGYDIDAQTFEDLYAVWDRGANYEMFAAKRLYEMFEELIDDNEYTAEILKQKLAEQKYKMELELAKLNGVSLELDEPVVIEPYGKLD